MRSVKVVDSRFGGLADADVIDANFKELEQGILRDCPGCAALTQRVSDLEAAESGDDTITFGKYSMAAHDASIRDAERKRAVGIVKGWKGVALNLCYRGDFIGDLCTAILDGDPGPKTQGGE